MSKIWGTCHSESGRFIARDPVLGPLDMPLEHGAYVYTMNNPVNMKDPSGLFSLGFCGSGQIGAGAFGTCSFCIIANTSRQIGLTASFGIGGTTGITAGIGLDFIYSSVSTLNKLGGIDAFVGGSTLLGGGDISVNENNSDYSINAGPEIGPDLSPLPPYAIELHGGAQKTYYLPLIE